jgi:hypothetical protein
MAGLVPGQYAQYYGVISGAVAEKASVQDIWALINAYEEQEGISRPAQLFQAVNQMRSIAATNRNSGSLLSAAADSAIISAEMVAQNINSRPLNEQALAPAYTVRYQATVLTGEGEDTVWRSLMLQGNLPATKGELVDLVINSFLDDAAAYQGQTATGLTGQLNISAV